MPRRDFRRRDDLVKPRQHQEQAGPRAEGAAGSHDAALLSALGNARVQRLMRAKTSSMEDKIKHDSPNYTPPVHPPAGEMPTPGMEPAEEDIYEGLDEEEDIYEGL